MISGEEFGRAVKVLRGARGVSQESLAKEVGIPKGTLGYWEAGRLKGVPRAALEKLFRALGVNDVDDLMQRAHAIYAAAAGTIGTSDSVSGVVEQSDRDGWRDRDVYDQLGAAGLLMKLNTPAPIGKERPPAKYEARIGPNGIGFRVQGESMVSWPKRPIFDGDTIWINRDDERWAHGVVVAIVEKEPGDDLRAVVKFYDGEGGLWSYPPGGVRERYPVYKIHTMTPAIVKTSPPGEF